MMNKLNDRGFKSIYAANERLKELDALIASSDILIDELEEKNKILSSIINAHHIYNDNLKYFQNYNSSKDKEKYFERHESEINNFISAGELLLKYKIPFDYDINNYIDQLNENNKEITKYRNRINPLVEERADLLKILNELDKYTKGIEEHSYSTHENNSNIEH